MREIRLFLVSAEGTAIESIFLNWKQGLIFLRYIQKKFKEFRRFFPLGIPERIRSHPEYLTITQKLT